MSFFILIDISVGFQWKGVMILKGFEGAYSKEIYKKLKHDILSFFSFNFSTKIDTCTQETAAQYFLCCSTLNIKSTCLS